MKRGIKRSSIIAILFLISLGLIHALVLKIFPQIYAGKELVLSYFVLVFLEVIRLTLFYGAQKKKIKLDFIQLFMAFTTVQLMACFGYAVFMKLQFPLHAKSVLLQFVCLFFITLFYQVLVIQAHSSHQKEEGQLNK